MTDTEALLMDCIIPSDAYALELAEQFNIEYGLSWIPEYVQYLATKADLLLDDNLIDHLSLLLPTNKSPKMSDSRFIITTTLEGYINALVPSGKFNNCTIGFRIPEEEIPKFDAVYEQALEWGKNKMAGKRFSAELPKWDEEGMVKVSYGGDSSSPMFPWVDTDGVPIDLDTQIWKGTVVKLIVDLKPYVFGAKVGCSLKVRGAQVLKLVSGGGSDSGGLDESSVAALFGKSEGFKTGSPSFEPNEDPGEGPVGYDEDDVPF